MSDTPRIAHTPGPWGIERTDNKNWIGPMRPDGLKVRAIVTALERGRDLKREVSDRNDADAALIAAAPALLAAVEKAYRWMLGERDCYYEGACDNDGNVPHADDREALAAIDSDLDEMRSLIAWARGET